MVHPAVGSPLWETAWRTQPDGGPAILGGDYDPDVVQTAYRHGYFPMVDQTSWRAFMRHDGKPWLNAPLSYGRGSEIGQLSPFVVLGDVAT